MPEPHAPVTDPEPDSVSTLDHSRPRSRFVDAAALAVGVLFGAGSAFVFFRLSLSWPGFGPTRLLAAYDAVVGGSLGYCLGVRAVLGVAGAGSVMGSRFLPVVGAAYLGSLARLVLVRFVPAPISFFTLILPFVGGLFGYLLSPGRERRSASGASSEGASPQPVTLLRLVDLSLAGLAGGVVGAVASCLLAVFVSTPRVPWRPGGLTAYLVSRRTRRSYAWWLVAGVLFVTLTAAPALSIIKGRTSLPFTIRVWPARTDLPAFLRYPGVAATTRPMNYYSGTCIEYSFQTTDSIAAVVAFYRKALAGWQEVRAPGPQDGTAIFYRSRDGKQHVSGWAVRIGPRDSAMTSLSLLYQRGGRGVIVPAHP